MLKVPRFEQEIYLHDLQLSHNAILHNEFWQNLYFFDSGISSLISILDFVYGKRNINIGLPAYSCFSLVNAIVSTGRSIKLIDIVVDNDGYKFNINNFSDIDCLIFIHYFGCYNSSLDEISCMYPNLKIIEDCSHLNILHTPLSRRPQFFSFALHKPVAFGFGGAVRWECQSYAQYVNVFSDINNFSLARLLIFSFLRSLCFNVLIYRILVLFRVINRAKLSKLSSLNLPEMLPNFFVPIIYKKANRMRHHNANYSLIPSVFRLPVSFAHSLSYYYPVFFRCDIMKEAFRELCNRLGIEIYVLWENCSLNMREIDEAIENYPDTMLFLENTIFIPKKVFSMSKTFGLLLTFFKLRLERCK